VKNIYEVKSSNLAKSYIIIGSFFLFSVVVIYVLTKAFGYYTGYVPGGLGYFGIAFLFSGITTFFSYYFVWNLSLWKNNQSKF